MTDKVKQFLSQRKILDLIDDENYTEVYKLCNNPDRVELTEFLLSCNIRPDEYMTDLPEYYLASSEINEYSVSSNITTIGMCAFHWCADLVNINLPNSIISIGPGAFYYCYNLEHIVLPDSVQLIDGAAFRECNKLTDVTLPCSIQTVGMRAFAECNKLTKITIPVSVKQLDEGAFESCSRLETINYSGTIKQWEMISKGRGAFDNAATSVVRCTDGVTRTQ